MRPARLTLEIGELDLGILAQQREMGSVRPYFDLRPDLYETSARQELKIVQVH